MPSLLHAHPGLVSGVALPWVPGLRPLVWALPAQPDADSDGRSATTWSRRLRRGGGTSGTELRAARAGALDRDLLDFLRVLVRRVGLPASRTLTR